MDIVVRQAWFSTGALGGLPAIEVRAGMTQSVMYVDHSTLATTTSISYQSAQESSGPWFIEGSTATGSSGTASTRFAMRVTGPVGPWIRPFIHTASTGSFNFLLLGMG